MAKLKLNVYYSKQFDSLLVNFSNKPTTETNIEENVTYLYNNQELIGLNLFQLENQLQPRQAFCTDETEIENYILEKVNDDIFKKTDLTPAFVVGKVLDCKIIENSHLSACKIDLGNGLIEDIVCGAKNVKKDMIVVVATVESRMPNGLFIVPSKLKGYPSNGMLCSQTELGITNKFNNEGIRSLGKLWSDKIGKSFWKEYYEKY